VQVGKLLKNIKRTDQNKAVQGGFFLKIINVHARLFGTLEYGVLYLCTGVEWVEISQKNFGRFFGLRMFFRS